MECTRCGITNYSNHINIRKKTGEIVHRYRCKKCFRSFSDKVRKFSYKDKEYAIYTDGNSMYKNAFSDLGVSDLHFVASGKSETHMIEAVDVN